MKKNKQKILFAAAEAAPIVKVGGLADVVGSLPPALEKEGCDVRLILPLYGSINRRKYKLRKIISSLPVKTGNSTEKINVWTSFLPNSKVKIYFIENKEYFGKKNIYSAVGDKINNSEKFLFFSLAVLHVLPKINFIPDIIHCHDFHTALILDLIKTQNASIYNDVKLVYTIHNLNYQGKSEIDVLSTGNLTKDSLVSLSRDAQDGDINFMVQGILNADAVTTVSPTYAKEITTSFYGAGLEKIIRINKKKLSGILNGIDTEFFNPQTDKYIKKNFSAKNLANKKINKIELQKKLKLQVDEKTAIVGLVSRLVWQKGIDLITEKIINLNCQFVFLGTGQEKYEKLLQSYAKKFPRKVSAHLSFNIELAQLIYAGADIFLMPSRFEPCGLGQMIAMRYGTIPIVRSTGGLADTVNKDTGFSFKEYNSAALYKTLKNALNIYYQNPKKWHKLQTNGMKKDFTWNKSVKEYLKLYKNLVK